MKVSDLKVDATKEIEGVWVPWEGARFKIARNNNPRYLRIVAQLREEKRATLRGGGLTEEETVEIWRRAAAETLLVGWDGIENDDGTPKVWSKEAAYALLSEPGLQDLGDFVAAVSARRELFRNAAAARDLGNSVSSPGGGGSTEKTPTA